MTLTEEIGAKIKYYRKKRGLKIAELAALLHKTGDNADDRGLIKSDFSSCQTETKRTRDYQQKRQQIKQIFAGSIC